MAYSTGIHQLFKTFCLFIIVFALFHDSSVGIFDSFDSYKSANASTEQKCQTTLSDLLHPGDVCATVLTANVSNKKKAGSPPPDVETIILSLVPIITDKRPDIILLQESLKLFTKNKGLDRLLEAIPFGVWKKHTSQGNKDTVVAVNDLFFESSSFRPMTDEIDEIYFKRWTAALLRHRRSRGSRFSVFSYHGWFRPPVSDRKSLALKYIDQVSFYTDLIIVYKTYCQ
jgi:hypothetical protein